MPKLRVVSYNVRGLKDDRAALGEVIRELAPDVLFAQEAPRRFRWRQRCAELARWGGMIYASGGLPGLGNAILVSMRVDVEEAWGLRYPLTPGRHLRGAAFARCSVGRVPFLAVGSHLATDDHERPAQAALLASTIREAGGTAIFGGDINETEGGSAWRTLADGRIDAGVGDQTPTFSINNPQRRIDALFADESCRVSGYRVVDTPAVRRASDHFPIYAEVEL
ncbi:endonuclease/exonuclease/phosphatase family protein [Longispora sp. NPDC051575]|uniref:endonuclease/exonuclease/phosphatase family protein n=1 Tax=Longispora sp. NPDC051575 TaxID=3154943 RepID=UPI00341E1BB5